MSQLSERRLVENEVIFRDVNKNIQEFVDEEVGLESSVILPFYCECASAECNDRIKLSTDEYNQAHAMSNRHFVTKIGHEFPEIEKIFIRKQEYQIVEKFFPPPSAKNIKRVLKTIAN